MRSRHFCVTALVVLMLLTTVSNVPGSVGASYDLSQVAYYDRVKQEFSLTTQQETMLRNYGFTIVQMENATSSEYDFDLWQRFEDFYFRKVYGRDLPVFVTTDSILHLFHVVFDCSLRMIEDKTLYPMIYGVTQYAFEKSLYDYSGIQHDNSVAYWAIRNATVYFAVAMSLISGENAAVPSELAPDLNFFLNEIYRDEPQFVRYAASWAYPGNGLEVEYDFTQFTVRGHYLGVPRLERYFRTMMWYGNFPVFIPRSDENYTWSVSHIDDTAVVYTRDILKQDQTYFDDWMALYSVTSALVGESDSINPVSLEAALHNAFGDRDQYLDAVATPNGTAALRAELAKPEYEQRILGQALVSGAEVQVRYPIVFQFMGQRYVPDSFMFQMLCWDKTWYNSIGDRRLMPKSLDVFAVLGSERAYQLLTPDYDYENFTENMAVLKSKFENLTEDEWTHSSYMSWVYSLQSLTNVEYNASYPAFMRNLAWKDEKLNTASGSWAQLRHDTLLYAKQTYIPALICSYPEAFVEPNPTFYSRMQKLTERTIEAVNTMPSGSVASVILNSLATVKNVTQQLEVISTKELAQQPLAAEETDFIKKLVWNCASGGFVGWYVDTIHAIAESANYTSLLNVPVIADVATFPPGDVYDPPQILHVAVGYVNALVVLYPMINGTLVAAVGPVFSYYEFPLIGTKRLNDDEWKTMLTFNNRTVYLPEWVKSVYGINEPIYPEFPPMAMLAATIVISTVVVTVLKKIGGSKKTSRTLLRRPRLS